MMITRKRQSILSQQAGYPYYTSLPIFNICSEVKCLDISEGFIQKPFVYTTLKCTMGLTNTAHLIRDLLSL